MRGDRLSVELDASAVGVLSTLVSAGSPAHGGLICPGRLADRLTTFKAGFPGEGMAGGGPRSGCDRCKPEQLMWVQHQSIVF